MGTMRKVWTLVLLTSLLFANRTCLVAATLFDSRKMMDVDEIRPGMKGFGESVFEGTKIEPFHVSVLGVLKRIDAGGDAVLIRIEDGPVVAKGYGIIAGMSGSPIYLNGKLIGALSFGWSFAKEPIAGVTPIRQMLETFEPATAKTSEVRTTCTFESRYGPVRVAGKHLNRFVVQAGSTPGRYLSGEDTALMQLVATPLMVTGMRPSSIRELEKLLEPFNVVPLAAPGGAGPEVRSPLVPGSAIGAQLMAGDMDLTAIGTVTYVDGDRVLAFGHPFLGLGESQLPMTTAYINGVFSSVNSSFKLGSASVPVGTVTEDRTWCIGGKVGKKPDLVQALYNVTDKDRGYSRRLEYQVVRNKLLSPALLMMSFGESISNVVSPVREGTTEMKLVVKPEGLPDITRENIYTDAGGGGMMLFGGQAGPEGELMTVLSLLADNRFKRVTPQRVEATVTFTTKVSSSIIEKVFVSKTRVKPGETVTISVHLRPHEQPVTVKELQVQVPTTARSGPIRVGVAGGEIADRLKFAFGLRPPTAQTLQQEIQYFESQFRNDRIVVFMAMPALGVEMNGYRLPNLPMPFLEVFRGTGSGAVRMLREDETVQFPATEVVSGLGLATLMVETEELEKSGTFMPMGLEGPGAEGESPVPPDMERFGMEGSEGPDADTLIRDMNTVHLNGGRKKNPWQDLLFQGLKAGKAPPKEGNAPAKKEDLDTDSPVEMPSWEEVDEVEAEVDTESSDGTPSASKNHRTKAIARAPSTWIQASEKEFSKGKFERAYVQSNGKVALAPEVQSLYSNAQLYPMCQVLDPNGCLYVGTWLQPKVVRVDSVGNSSVFFESPTGAAISALAFEGGFLFAAESPTGNLYRISANGSSEKLCTLTEPMIWSLASLGEGNLLVGTGGAGKVFRVDKEGKATMIAQVPDRHVLSVQVTKQGQVYLLTHPKGKVYRLTSEGKLESVFESAKAGALAMTTDDAGILYVATSPRGFVYRVGTDGKVQELYKPREKNILSLTAGPEGSVYAGTGPRGNVFRISSDGTAGAMMTPDDSFITSLVRNATGDLYATTANANRILRLGFGGVQRGSFTSAVHAADTLAHWGTLQWDAETSEGAAVTVQTRSGNTAYPDKGWSDWSQPYTESHGTAVTSPPGRFLQYRLNFSGNGNKSPTVRRVAVIYMNQNRPPKVQMKSPGVGDHVSGKYSVRWTAKDPDSDKLKYQTFYSPDAGTTWVEVVEEKKKKAADKEAKTPEEPSTMEETKETTESAKEGDRPGVNIGEQKEEIPEMPTPEERPGKGFAVSSLSPESSDMKDSTEADMEPPTDMGEGMEGPSFDFGSKQSRMWDTGKIPDGVYQVKVVVSDEIANPKERLTAEVIEGPIVVDNTPPEALLPEPFKQIPTELVKVKVTDALSSVTSAEYRVDTGEWIAAAATDGIFDSKAEEVEIKPESITAGKHTLKVRVRDSAGSEKVFEVKYDTGGEDQAGKTTEPKKDGTGPDKPAQPAAGEKPKVEKRSRSKGKKGKEKEPTLPPKPQPPKQASPP